MTTELITERQRADLEAARGMAAAGIPLFIAQPDPSAKTGFRPPSRWEQTEPDPSVVDQWRPGLALCAVMGCGFDLIDIDPRNGGDVSVLGDLLPFVYGVAATPSGGRHLFIGSLGVGSRDNLWPGVDVKGGMFNGSGRGFAFLAPTVRASVVTGELRAYEWVEVPDPTRVDPADDSGLGLAARIREMRPSPGRRAVGGEAWWREFVDSREPQSAPAAEKAITAKLTEVAGWTPTAGVGFRTVLLRASLTLGGYVGGGYLDEDDARKRLDAAIVAVWGAANADDLRWVQQGLDDGAVQPFHVFTEADARRFSDAAQAVAREGEVPPADAGSSSQPPFSVFEVLGGEPFDPASDSSDQGLAKAVAARTFPVLRYATDSGMWVVRDRDLWRQNAQDMTEWAVAILAELMPLGDTPVPAAVGDRTEGHWRAVRRATFMSSAGSGKIAKKMRSILRSDHPSCLRTTDLDANPEVLWAGGIAWDLRASLDAPTPAGWVDPGTPHLHTALFAPDPYCSTPRWDAYTAVVWPDPQIRAWALRVLSIALTGYADAALPVLYGRERSGKTSMIEMLLTVLGSYGHAASPKLLSAQDSSHPEMIYDLKGRRLSFIDEGPRRGHDATERLKQITGGGSLTGRAMRANSVTFAPSHTLVMTTNPEPHMTDPALRARIRLIPCDATESDVRPVRMALLGSGLIAEAPGILAAMMRETAAYLADRDSASNASAPTCVRMLVEQLAADQDPVREWVENRTVPAEPGTLGRVLHRAFAQWHQENPMYRKTVIPSETFFGRCLSELGYPSTHTRIGKIRPLSILGWVDGSMPITPTPAAFLGQSVVTPQSSDVSGDESGQATGGGSGTVAGSLPALRPVDPKPATEQNSRSTPVFSDAVTGLNSSDNTHQSNKNTTYIRDIRNSRETGNHRSHVNPSHTPVGEVAKRANSANIGKAEARKLIKEEQRSASIAAAAGELHPLPVVVDRDGHLVPLTVDQASAVAAAAVTRSGALTVDVETTGYPVGHDDYALRTVQLGDATAAVVLDPVEHADTIRDLLARAPALHAHSATADLVPLAHAGLIDAESGWQRMHDTVIPAKLADPASTGSDPGLKQLASAVLGDRSVAPVADAGRAALFKAGSWLTDTKVATPLERSGWAQVDPRCATMLRYAASDVLDTAALAAQLPRPAPEVYERERLAQRMTARVTHHGIRLDVAHIAELTAQHTAARAAAADRVRAFDVDNPGSDAQVGRAATTLGATLPQTPSGRPSVAAGVLEPLRSAEGPIGDLVRAVLDYRHADTALGLFLKPYRLLCERGDGRARPTVYTLGADTGRMTSTRPNIQQLPREGGMRACLTADDGQLMIGADFSGVEIRVAAALSQDGALMRMLTDGRDLHAEIAALVWGPFATKADAKAARYRAKPMVFQRIYGGGVPGIARQAGLPIGTAQAVVDALDLLTPRLSAWSKAISDGVQRGQTQFPTYAGRVIHMPHDRSFAAGNYAIQGTARELLVDTLVRWRDTRWGSAVLIPVHDELDVFVPAADAEQATAELVRCMETTLYGVHIAAEPSTPAFAWADSV